MENNMKTQPDQTDSYRINDSQNRKQNIQLDMNKK